MSRFKFELGDQVRDLVTSYEGIVTGRTEWLNGCRRYLIELSKLNKDGEPVKGLNADEQTLVLVKALALDVGQNRADRPVAEGASPPGGPYSEPPKYGR
jgi:hypothetical protein